MRICSGSGIAHTRGGLCCFIPGQVMAAGGVGAGEGAARAWLPAALRDFACHSHLPFLPTAPLERKEENQTQSHYHRHLPGLGPRSPRFWLSRFPRGTLPQSLCCWLSGCTSWSFAVLLAQPALSPFFKTTLAPLGCLEPSLGPHLPPVSSTCPQSQGHTAEGKPHGLAVS